MLHSQPRREPPPTDRQKKISELQKKAEEHRLLTSHRFFFSYAWALFRRAPLYLHWQSLLSYIRRFRMITFLLRVGSILFTILETGALVLLSTAVFLVILPLAAALMLGILLTALLESKRTNRQLAAAVGSRPCCVLFLSEEKNPFLLENTKSLAACGKTVFVVSPYWISPKGLSSGRFYCTARREAAHIYLVRRYYFFSLRKHVLKKAGTVYLY